MNVNKVVNILMQRDEISKNDAQKIVEETQKRMRECCYDPFEVENIMYNYLGLEMDYIFDLLPI